MDTASVYSPLDKQDITLAEWYSPFDGGGGGGGGGVGAWWCTGVRLWPPVVHRVSNTIQRINFFIIHSKNFSVSY